MSFKTITFLTVCLACALFGQNHYLVTLSTIKARPLALGGAFMAMQNEWAALYYNPAGYHVSRNEADKKLAVTLNPLGPILAFTEKDHYQDGSVPIGWTVNAVGIQTGMISWGLLAGEESLTNSDRLNRCRFFDATDYPANRNATIGLSIAFAPKVRFGMAGDMFIREGGLSKMKFGYRYGLIVKPRDNLDVGLCYVDFPKENIHDRLELERLVDETLNIGLAYTPYRFMTFFADVRNVSGENKGAMLEPHLGAELNILSYVFVRCGYFRSRGGEEKTASFGLGAQDMLRRLFWDLPRSPVRLDVDATLIWQQTRTDRNQWFLLAMRMVL